MIRGLVAVGTRIALITHSPCELWILDGDSALEFEFYAALQPRNYTLKATQSWDTYTAHSNAHGDILFASCRPDFFICLLDRKETHLITLHTVPYGFIAETPVVCGSLVMVTWTGPVILIFDLNDLKKDPRKIDIAESFRPPDGLTNLCMFASLRRTPDGRVVALVASERSVAVHSLSTDGSVRDKQLLALADNFKPIASAPRSWLLYGDTLLMVGQEGRVRWLSLSAKCKSLQKHVRCFLDAAHVGRRPDDHADCASREHNP